MQWDDEAIIIKQQQFSDDKLLCWFFSSSNGLYKGLVSLNKKNRCQIQVGNIVNATWRARLSEHLGTCYCELIKPLSMSVLNDKLKINSISSLCSILSSCLPERVVEKKIYNYFLDYLLKLKDQKDWLIDYLRVELILLEELGYGLDLESCALTGEKEGLYYVSPNTGKAVTKEAGAPYYSKLLKLPGFFLNREKREQNDIVDGFKLTGHFIDKFLCMSYAKTLPATRVAFLEQISNNSCN